MALYRIRSMGYAVRKKIVKHFYKKGYKDKIMNEVYNGYIKFNLVMEIAGHKYPTSVTLKKNIVSLWLVMMEKIHCDHNREVLSFIEEVCMKRWQGNTAKGMSDFILKCMIHSIMEKDDWENFKLVYRSLNGRVHNPQKISNTKHGEGYGKIVLESTSDPIQTSNKSPTKFTTKKTNNHPSNLPQKVSKKKVIFSIKRSNKSTIK